MLRRILLLAVFGLGVGGLASCSSDAEPGEFKFERPSEQRCIPGERRQCACPDTPEGDHVRGVQPCTESGVFGVCDCPEVPTEEEQQQKSGRCFRFPECDGCVNCFETCVCQTLANDIEGCQATCQEGG